LPLLFSQKKIQVFIILPTIILPLLFSQKKIQVFIILPIIILPLLFLSVFICVYPWLISGIEHPVIGSRIIRKKSRSSSFCQPLFCLFFSLRKNPGLHHSANNYFASSCLCSSVFIRG